MASRFLTARFDRGTLTLAVHMDTTLVDAGGAPLPDSVRHFTFGAPRRNAGEAQAAYRARLRAFADTQIPEAQRLVQAELAAPDPAGQVTLTEEGTTF